MKKEFKGFIIGVCCTTALSIGVTQASTLLQNIEVAMNTATVKVDDKTVQANNFIHEGTTYVPLRAISESLKCDIGWDQDTRTVSIDNYREPHLKNMTATMYSLIRFLHFVDDLELVADGMNIFRDSILNNHELQYDYITKIPESLNYTQTRYELLYETSTDSNYALCIAINNGIIDKQDFEKIYTNYKLWKDYTQKEYDSLVNFFKTGNDKYYSDSIDYSGKAFDVKLLIDTSINNAINAVIDHTNEY